MNLITHKEIYIQLKSIFDGCDTILDAMHFSDIYINKYPDMKSIILSYMNGRIYKDCVDIKTKQSMLYDINMCDTRDDALDSFGKIIGKSSDDIYRKTLERLAYRKNYRKLEHKKVELLTNICKKCPHCSHVINLPENTQYVICGYHNTHVGYDWNGCGRDWCFRCNKMLCKRWETNNLQLQMNRFHDEDCCLKHSIDNGYTYPNDYCQCNNGNINKLII